MYTGEIKLNTVYNKNGEEYILVTECTEDGRYFVSDVVFEEDENGDLIPDPASPNFDFKWHLDNERLVTENHLRYMIYD